MKRLVLLFLLTLIAFGPLGSAPIRAAESAPTCKPVECLPDQVGQRGPVPPPTWLLDAMQPLAVIVALIFGGVGFALLIVVGRAIARTPRRLAWGISRRFTWWFSPLAIAALVLLQGYAGANTVKDRLWAVEVLFPLATLAGAGVCFSPREDSAAEILFVAPRPAAWILVERLLWVMLPNLILAMLCGLILTVGRVENVAEQIGLVVRTLPPMVLLGGAAAFITLRSGLMVMGTIASLLIWIGANLFGPLLMPGMPVYTPFNYLQPFIWLFAPFTRPDTISAPDYLLNRVVVAGVGLALMGWAAWGLRNTEQVLYERKK